jgi:hypothetical protein
VDGDGAQLAQFGQHASRIDPQVYDVVFLDEQVGS